MEKEQIYAADKVGMPVIVNFQSKRMMKMIIELRDKAITTHFYVIDLNGRLNKFCHSLGYGLPYATQFTAPQKVGDHHESGFAVLPQADRNGWFSPADAEGTWILHRDPNPDKTEDLGTMPVYIEPRIAVSPFELPAAG
jgi:hypothetical protein